MVDRIQKIIKYKKLTPSRFADEIGVPRSTISHIISGRNNPSLEFLQKVLDTYPDIKTEWLVRGEGTMVRQSGTLFQDEDFESLQNVPPSDSLNTTEKSQNKSDNESVTQSIPENIPSNTAHIQKPTDQNTEKIEPGSDMSIKPNRIVFFYQDGTFVEYKPS